MYRLSHPERMIEYECTGYYDRLSGNPETSNYSDHIRSCQVKILPFGQTGGMNLRLKNGDLPTGFDDFRRIRLIPQSKKPFIILFGLKFPAPF